jgi:hypothetical protein
MIDLQKLAEAFTGLGVPSDFWNPPNCPLPRVVVGVSNYVEWAGVDENPSLAFVAMKLLESEGYYQLAFDCSKSQVNLDVSGEHCEARKCQDGFSVSGENRTQALMYAVIHAFNVSAARPTIR